ncbi:MAG: hypothetical protein V4753_17570 [Pseudomonadota bacterium]
MARIILLIPAVILAFFGIVLFDRFLSRDHENLVYADSVFSGVVQYERVLASRRWHDFLGSDGYDCTYAVVELADEAPSSPPQMDPKQRNRIGNPGKRAALQDFSGNWIETSGDFESTFGSSILRSCEHRLDSALYEKMVAALHTSGGWTREQGNDRFWVYSVPTRLAFRLRYGD